MQHLLEQHPELKAQMDAQEQFIKNFTGQLANFKNETDTPLYIIPVVFHVIHSGGRENVPKSYLLDAIQKLNDDFSRRNADTTDTPDAFKPIAANCRIEFRLATPISTNANNSFCSASVRVSRRVKWSKRSCWASDP